ncbi:hypothetical protein D5S17_26885 [Pseudonocardiaceae bacterium YIM PH 21723]|nr:hypothetical protein D5S17_26885 [Pseudonocardiaceae bacterium YIM PH 21723]
MRRFWVVLGLIGVLGVAAVAVSGRLRVSSRLTELRDIEVPTLKGINAEIAHIELKRMGLRNVHVGSTHKIVGVPIVLANWTVVEMQPVAGTLVRSDTPIMLLVSKH